MLVAHQVWTTYEGPIKNGAVVEYGEWAALELGTGELVPAAAVANQVVIGVFLKSATGVGVGADRTRGSVKLFRPVPLWGQVNGGALDAADVGGPCYLVNGTTVSHDDASGTRPVAGRVWGFRGGRVLVEPVFAMAGTLDSIV